jgi:hypothetical protein
MAVPGLPVASSFRHVRSPQPTRAYYCLAELQAAWLIRMLAQTVEGSGTQSPAAGPPADVLEWKS